MNEGIYADELDKIASLNRLRRKLTKKLATREMKSFGKEERQPRYARMSKMAGWRPALLGGETYNRRRKPEPIQAEPEANWSRYDRVYAQLEQESNPARRAALRARLEKIDEEALAEYGIQKKAAKWDSIPWKDGDGYSYQGPVDSPRKNKKKMVRVKRGGQTKTVHFGHSSYSDFTKHKSKKRRDNYLKRSGGIRNKSGQLTKDDPFSANHWARKVLW